MRGHLDDGELPLLVDGSALRPELARAALADERVRGVWRTASDDAVTDRIAQHGGRGHAAPPLAELIDIFTARTLRVRCALARHGLEAPDATDDETVARSFAAFAGLRLSVDPARVPGRVVRRSGRRAVSARLPPPCRQPALHP